MRAPHLLAQVEDCLQLLNTVLEVHGGDEVEDGGGKRRPSGAARGSGASPSGPLAHLRFNRTRLAVYGGSHGGFLTAHLIGTLFSAHMLVWRRRPSCVEALSLSSSLLTLLCRAS